MARSGKSVLLQKAISYKSFNTKIGNTSNISRKIFVFSNKLWKLLRNSRKEKYCDQICAGIRASFICWKLFYHDGEKKGLLCWAFLCFQRIFKHILDAKIYLKKFPECMFHLHRNVVDRQVGNTHAQELHLFRQKSLSSFFCCHHDALSRICYDLDKNQRKLN